jgi:hypothetical protein
MRRVSLLALLTVLVSLLVGVTGAQAIVVDMNSPWKASGVPFDPFNQSGYVGVRLLPASSLQSAGVPNVTSYTGGPQTPGPCLDPALTSDMLLQPFGLCWHNGSVLHKNQTFAFVWDPNPYKNFTAGYVEQFLRDVADGTGTLTSPYAETGQYSDAGGPAANTSVYGGGYDDSGSYPSVGCGPTDPTETTKTTPPLPAYYGSHNSVCLTDAQIKTEIQSMITSNGIVGRMQPGYSPVIAMLLPPGVEVCLGSNGNLCSANSAAPARFCSYHSQVLGPNGVVFPYVVQPFTARRDTGGGVIVDNTCDEPDVAPFPATPPDSATLAKLLGARLVSPLSESYIAAIINPNLNAWFAQNGTESDDNGCVPQKDKLDQVQVGTSSQNPYILQREFNNAGAIVNDVFAMPCVPGVYLNPVFVVPSAINQGDVVQFDGAATQSTLLVPKANYHWDFGDGTTAVGPSQVHPFTKGGSYAVKLTVTDRGGNTATLSQTIVVLGPTGQVVTNPGGGGSGGAGGGTVTPLQVRIQLMPQGLKMMLHTGVSIHVTSNQAANGIVTVSITRAAALRAHIHAGSGPSVVIGRGTVSKIKSGTVALQLRLSRTTAKKLARLGHLTVTVSLGLVGAGSGANHVTIVAAGRY